MEKLIDKISEVLKTIKYPGFSRDIVSFGIIKKIKINDDVLFIDISLETNNNANKEIIRDEIFQKININFQFKRVEVNFNSTTETEKKSIETAIADLRNALKGTDAEEIKKKTQSLIQASMKLGEAVYKSQQKTAGKADNSKDNKENKDKDNVVDADFEDVKKDDKDDKEKRA